MNGERTIDAGSSEQGAVPIHPLLAQPRVWRVVADVAIVIGALSAALAGVLPIGDRMPWVVAAGVSGVVVIGARIIALRQQS